MKKLSHYITKKKTAVNSPWNVYKCNLNMKKFEKTLQLSNVINLHEPFTKWRHRMINYHYGFEHWDDFREFIYLYHNIQFKLPVRKMITIDATATTCWVKMLRRWWHLRSVTENAHTCKHTFNCIRKCLKKLILIRRRWSPYWEDTDGKFKR